MSYYSPTTEENEVYKQLFQAASRGQSATIGGTDAVKFFVASGLPIATLKQVWALASNGQKEMGPREFSTAMRLIALAQAGHAVNEDTLHATQGAYCAPPKFQGVEVSTPATTPPSQAPTPPTAAAPVPPAASSPTSFAIPPEQRAGYEKLWNSLQKNPNGMLEGKDAAAFFAKSGQSREVLRNVWQLSDMNGDGMMDLTEFLIGMHLTMMAKKGATLPSSLPQDLLQSVRAPLERNNSNVSLSTSTMMANMGLNAQSSHSLMYESEKDLISSRLQKQGSSSRSADISGLPVPAAYAPPSAVPSAVGGDEHESLRQDASAINSSLAVATSRIEEARNSVKAQTVKASSELSALRAERERLMQSLAEATTAFNNDMEKLRKLDEELSQMRDEVSRLRQGVDAKRAAVGAQQDMIGAKLDETRNLTKQMAGAALGSADQAGQKRRQPPVPPPGGGSNDFFSGIAGEQAPAPQYGENAFDQFDADPYGAGKQGGF